ncbi:hypothetical protein PAP18089_04362 [Pandoraea apista]|uniref:Uncharacterized protein n=1 Tax=Pandoraea apista TaxID=93218 RepID=A0A5E5P9Y8_9BURK|nr:hypothetical protein [Pandoraea apista]VVG73357.1 hypothetical protein PAP18089_04362 [Pandoraea apista]
MTLHRIEKNKLSKKISKRTDCLPKDFSGVAEFSMTTFNYLDNSTSVKTYNYYYYLGNLHRMDGPAVLLEGEPNQWWINGRQYSEEEYGRFIEKKALKENLEILLESRPKEKTKKI